MTSRPHFDPILCNTETSVGSTLPLTDGHTIWHPMVACPIDFSIEIFERAARQLVEHPEYNSTLILRSEQICEWDADFPNAIPQLVSLHPIRCIRRKLLARRPGRDAPIEQYCSFHGQEGDSTSSIVVLTPIVEPGCSLPYYHPAVHHIAFRYISSSETRAVQVEVQPLPDVPTDPDSRLYRTCLALLETIHRYGWGAMTNYKKRVNHDLLVPRQSYQDLYLIMRERHKHLINTWQEVTDPLKHVFEDIGIATYLMLLWKETYSGSQQAAENTSQDEPWRTWPRPPQGFLDFGCGNGLLTHILTVEGYQGHGIDLRSRTSWSHYSPETRAHLHVYTFNPLLLFSSTNDPYLIPDVFIIGNHADELTPWVPVISTLTSASGYLSIPCCAWTFDMKYDRSKAPEYPLPDGDFIESLNLGGFGNNESSYSMYRIWLASLSLHCGWEVECENLRIPSTRNWALIGRNRSKSPDGLQAVSNVNDIVLNVSERGIYKARTPEGKASYIH
ncbi:hypothetical protein AX15_001742 [Amanita polypyramis BW_CC]|nr:hypothetical protein AX15_001742 [Amanita polypyramis BW_CC]